MQTHAGYAFRVKRLIPVVFGFCFFLEKSGERLKNHFKLLEVESLIWQLKKVHQVQEKAAAVRRKKAAAPEQRKNE